jgi:hypothetical protein
MRRRVGLDQSDGARQDGAIATDHAIDVLPGGENCALHVTRTSC